MSQATLNCNISTNYYDSGNDFDNLNTLKLAAKFLNISTGFLRNDRSVSVYCEILTSRNSTSRKSFPLLKDYNLNVDKDVDFCRRVFTAAASAKGRAFVEPEQVSQNNSLAIISFLSKFDFTPKFINPLPEGGIMVEYYSINNSYLLFEFFDDEEIVFFQRVNGTTTILSFEAIPELKNNLQSLIDNGEV